jgi:DnaJ like chaperone protein
MIEQISIHMAVQQADYQSMLALYQRQKDLNWAYTALEIQPTATDEEVKKAYRRMAMKYHPDKVANAGEEIRQQATEKFRGINEAYEYIKQQRGL